MNNIGDHPIKFERVSFEYGTDGKQRRPIFAAASFDLNPAEVVTIVGESGSGKTTLLNLLAGLLVPTGGTIVRHQRISYLQQEDLLLPFRSVLQNACLAAELRNVLDDQLIRKCLSLFKRLRLLDFKDELPNALSGGMRRRVACVRQVLPPAGTLLLDEPFGAQDRGMRQTLEDLIYEICRAEKRSAIVVTHDLDSAIAVSDRVLLVTRAKGLKEIWKTAPGDRLQPPTARREQPSFVANVAQLLQMVWEEQSHD